MNLARLHVASLPVFVIPLHGVHLKYRLVCSALPYGKALANRRQLICECKRTQNDKKNWPLNDMYFL